MRCPHCGSEFGVQKGGLSLLPSDLSSEDQRSDQKETPKKGRRGKAREYTPEFEVAWRAYGRKEQKFEAFGVWLLRAKEVGGEARLMALVVGALKWQTLNWAQDGWKFAPYFERYLKRRKWEDERPSVQQRPASTLPPWKQAERDEEARKRQEASEEAKAMNEMKRALGR